MSSFYIENVNTKLEAYKLVHDPTRLLCLLYSKYGDIEEDYYLSYINQLFYNVSSHYNCIYKENQYLENIEEFLKRYYRKHESRDRVPKLSEYYKNYLVFFCRPLFRNYKLGKVLHDYEDKKAEIFYKNNYADSINELEEKEKENSGKKSYSSLSSLDNITNNKIIFDKRTKNIIDNNLNTELCTLTLTSESSRNLFKDNNDTNNIYNGCLISKRSNINSSFEKYIYSLVHSQFHKKLKNKIKNKKIDFSKKSQSRRKKKLANSPSSHPPYISKIYKKNYLHNHNYYNKDFSKKNKKIKNSLYTIARKNYMKQNYFFSYKNDKGFLSPKITKHLNFNNGISSKLQEFNKNRPNNYIHNSAKKNKTYNITNNNNNTNNKTSKTKNNHIKNLNFTNINSIYKNFSNLSESLNKYKNLTNKNSNITFTNKNNSGIAKTKKNNIITTNVLIKSNNNENKKIKKKINTNINKTTNNNQLKSNNLISINKNTNINLNINKPQFRHAKNKTFDFNTINQSEPLSKYNSNNNFDNFKALLNNNNKNNEKRKINSKFNLIKKPINEVIKNPILSPQAKRVYNKITINQSISQNKEKKKKIFYGLNNNSNNYNLQRTKLEYESPKGQYSHKKKNNMTFSSEDNNKIENINIEGIIKNNKNQNKPNNKKQIKKNSNKYDSLKSNQNNWKIKTSNASPLSNYSSNLNKIVKNTNYSSSNNTIRIDNSTSINNNSQALKSTKKVNLNNINININNINSNLDNNSNKINNELLDMININQNDNCVVSRNKKQNTSKISNTQSQNEINPQDIHIKTIKNLKASSMSTKTHVKNMTCSNDSNSNSNINYLIPKYHLNYNLSKINSSTEVKNNQIKDILFKLNKISIKKKSKNSQRLSKRKEKNKFYIKPKYKLKNKGMLSGDNIFNCKKTVEMKQNSLKINSRMMQKDNNNNVKSNNTISHRERGNSLQIINVNRNIKLFKNSEHKNLQKLTKV